MQVWLWLRIVFDPLPPLAQGGPDRLFKRCVRFLRCVRSHQIDRLALGVTTVAAAVRSLAMSLAASSVGSINLQPYGLGSCHRG